ncbi:MAG: hypothetical protein K1X53_14505 [Candidatus Sumerlaeaceae bacterium]|nr:hypothetical protein [Candidatus Sumerlaeaceae bacterium]
MTSTGSLIVSCVPPVLAMIAARQGRHSALWNERSVLSPRHAHPLLLVEVASAGFYVAGIRAFVHWHPGSVDLLRVAVLVGLQFLASLVQAAWTSRATVRSSLSSTPQLAAYRFPVYFRVGSLAAVLALGTALMAGIQSFLVWLMLASALTVIVGWTFIPSYRINAMRAFPMEDTPISGDVEKIARYFGAGSQAIRFVSTTGRQAFAAIPTHSMGVPTRDGRATVIPCRNLLELDPDVYLAALTRAMARVVTPDTMAGLLISNRRRLLIFIATLAIPLALVCLLIIALTLSILGAFLDYDNPIGGLAAILLSCAIVYRTICAAGREVGFFPTSTEAMENAFTKWWLLDGEFHRNSKDFVLHQIRYLREHEDIRNPGILCRHVEADTGLMAFSRANNVGLDSKLLVEESTRLVERMPRERSVDDVGWQARRDAVQASARSS